MKAVFDSIYTAPDPRPYYGELARLDYQIPHHGGRLFTRLVDQLRERRGAAAAEGGIRVVDLCSSYGVVATAMKHRRPFDDVMAHYTGPEVAELDSAAMAAADRRFFADSPDLAAWVHVVGIDIAAPAVEYAERVGILDVGLAADLESEEPTDELVGAVRGADLVTCTGGIGYITDVTVGRILDHTPPDVWFATLCLRWVDMGPVIAELGRRGLVTERLDGASFRQRRFANDDEREFARAETERLGLELAPDDGFHHADLYVARPADESAPPLAELVAGDT